MHAWREAVRESQLDKHTKLVAFVLSTYMNASGGAYPSKATLARGGSLSERGVDAAVNRLSSSGFVIVGRRRGRQGFTYDAVIPQPVRDANPHLLRDSPNASRTGPHSIPQPTTGNPAPGAGEVVEEVEKEVGAVAPCPARQVTRRSTRRAPSDRSCRKVDVQTGEVRPQTGS